MLSLAGGEFVTKLAEKKTRILADMKLSLEVRQETASILTWAISQAKRILKGERYFVVYLSGSIDGLTYDEASAQRNRMTEMLEAEGILVRDPMRGKENLKGCKRINSEEMMKISDRVYTPKEITARDLHDLRMSDAILVLTGDNLSWGTQGEFWWATWVGNLPRCVLCKTDRYRDSLWLKEYATRIVTSEEEAVETLAIWANLWNPVPV